MTPTDARLRDILRRLANSCLSASDAADVAQAWLPHLTDDQRRTHMAEMRVHANGLRLLVGYNADPAAYIAARWLELDTTHRLRAINFLEGELAQAVEVAILTDGAQATHGLRDALEGQGYCPPSAAAIVGRVT